MAFLGLLSDSVAEPGPDTKLSDRQSIAFSTASYQCLQGPLLFFFWLSDARFSFENREGELVNCLKGHTWKTVTVGINFAVTVSGGPSYDGDLPIGGNLLNAVYFPLICFSYEEQPAVGDADGPCWL